MKTISATTQLVTAMLAFALVAGATYANAQQQSDMKMKKGGEDSCPMMDEHEGMPELTAKVENTTTGAIVRITAKQPADTAKVQAFAAKLAKHLENGCPMMQGMMGKDGMGMGMGMKSKHGKSEEAGHGPQKH